MSVEERLANELHNRAEKQLLRTLTDYSKLIDFASNDYLSFGKLPFENGPAGGTGSRLISGTQDQILEIEKELASIHNFESGLIFNSGYTANIGLFSTIPSKNDVIFYDKLIHASIRDGLQLSKAKSIGFSHNDLDDLEQKLKRIEADNVFVVVESVYSMDGDSPNFEKLIELTGKHNLKLIVDEAHAVGIQGKNGEGLIHELGYTNDVFALVVPYGKAMGLFGAGIFSSKIVIDYLINYCRSFIYTTAFPITYYQILQDRYNRLKETKPTKSKHLKELFISELKSSFKLYGGEYGNIVSVSFSGNDNCKKTEAYLSDKGFFAKAILNPTVAEGQERIRICFHEHNTEEEVKNLINALKKGK